MQLRQLQHLVALAEQGSFGRAAQAVHLSQPALSRSIDTLEDSLQARLIDRAYGTVRFTQAGELVLARARELLADAQQIQRDVLQLEGLAIGSLAVGLGPFAASTLGRMALSLMTQRHPQLLMRMEVADTATLSERLHRRQLDLFIADTRDLKKQPGLKLARLPDLPVSFFVQPKHPLRRLKQVTLEKAMRYPVAGPNLPAEVAAYFDSQIQRDDRGVFNVTCDDAGTLRHLALTANAVILAPHAPALNTDTNALVPLPVVGFARMQTHYSLVTLAGRTPSAAATVYTRLVTELMGPVRQPAGR
ncbi:DNA-binding transcriptional regulator, LysR family [Variovorax sp. OV084]|jgi:DNA-binding transcriptional LysR family regulator|uniref:LysR family transcriptional regulator n=2 Tax=Variovorax TaxID=34072 RepID=UPI0008D01C28|nr:DNA-binding transcriptional regulator, LysR family [Variovorax sp. OV084]SOD21697.1 DNA-binding transcriptional regulator, LysR family [Variovorax sp. YR752]